MTDDVIIAEALSKTSAAERTAYLEAVCDGAEQRARVDAHLGNLTQNADVTRSVVDADITRTGPADDRHGETLDATSFLARSERPGAIGRLAHYDVQQVLGQGGFGIVYKAFDDKLQRAVAVKVLAPHLASSPAARKRFLREARSAAAVRHENVVQVYAVEEQPLPFLVMEYLPGETLQQRVDRTGPLELLEVVRLGRQIAAGLAAAHAQALIHRDIKPSNILLDAGSPPAAKITDFGLARAADDASLTRSGTVAGTPMFMAPEQARGETLDQRADLFSLGSVLYALASGRPPFQAGNTLAVLKRVVEDRPRPIRDFAPDVPGWFCRIVEKLHAKDPGDRFQTAQEVADLLADCERQLVESDRLTDTSRIPAAARPPVKRKGVPAWVWVLVAVLGLMLVVCIGLPLASMFFWMLAGDKPQALDRSVNQSPPPLAPDGPAAVTAMGDPRLEGDWVVVSSGRGEQGKPTADDEETFLHLGDGKFEMLVGGRWSQGTCTTDAGKQELVLSTYGERVLPPISYRFDGDRLRLTVDTDRTPGDSLAQLSRRAESLNRLKVLALAAHNYEQVFSSLPPAGLPSPRGNDPKPLLSWRVALLPFVEHDPLYRQFKLDEPWDSEHNKKLIPKMPKVYATPGANCPIGQTNYQAFVGPGTPFEVTKGGIKLAAIPDGTSNTLLFVEAADPVIWTKPDDLPYDPKQPLPKLGATPHGVNVAWADGSVDNLSPLPPEKTLRLMIIRHDGEVLPRPEPGKRLPPLRLECVRSDFRPLVGAAAPLWVNPTGKPTGWKQEGSELNGRNATPGWYRSDAVVPAHFHLRAEVKVSGPGDARLHFPDPTGVSVDVSVDLSTRAPGVFGGLMKDGKVLASPSDGLNPTDWCRVEVIAYGRQWRVLVDGKQTAEYRAAKADRGKLELMLGQAMTPQDGDDLVIRFRKVEIRELPAPPE